MATGRVPKIQGLGLEEVGVQLGEQHCCLDRHLSSPLGRLEP
jgi:pyruvate/2-oxoglutarate dehydrogenase complex dihydrolipoamide dehydrogenase (E3) component